MIFSYYLLLKDNQNPLRTACALIFWSWVWPSILCWDKLGGDFRARPEPEFSRCVTTSSPCQPLPWVGPFHWVKKNFLPVTHPFCFTRFISIPTVDLDTETCLEKYSSSIQSAPTLLFPQKTKHVYKNQWTKISKYFFFKPVDVSVIMLAQFCKDSWSSLTGRRGQGELPQTTENIQTQRYLFG